jgi:hypothetical protein
MVDGISAALRPINPVQIALQEQHFVLLGDDAKYYVKAEYATRRADTDL